MTDEELLAIETRHRRRSLAHFGRRSGYYIHRDEVDRWDALNLRNTVYSALHRDSRTRTIEGVAALGDEALLRLRYFGPKSLAQVREVIPFDSSLTDMRVIEDDCEALIAEVRRLRAQLL